jgi:hypothetical protein
MDHVVHFSVFGAQNIDALLFFLRWAYVSFHKKHARTRYVEVLFLLSVGSAGRVVRYDASEAQNVDALFFMLIWDRYRFHKKCVDTRYAEHVFLHLVGSIGHIVHSGESWA